MDKSLLSVLGALLAFSIAALPVQAQRWTGALKAGGTATTFTGETNSGDTEWDPRIGLVGGVAVGYDFSNGFIPHVEFLYVRKGASADVFLGELPLRIRSDLTYLQVPLLLQYRFERRGYLHPKLFAGPMVAFRLDSRLRFTTEGSDIEQVEDDASIEDRDFGGLAGIGVDFDTRGQRLTFEARFSFGISDITKPSDVGNPELYNRGLEFLFGFVF